MANKWLDKQYAEEWDAKTNDRNPIRMEQLDIVASIASDTYAEGSTIVDLGFGSGHLEEMILRRRPRAKIIGIDSSQAMIGLADRRLSPLSKHYRSICHNLSDIESLQLDTENVRTVLCVQTLHHLAPEHQEQVLSWTYDTLEEGGSFIIVDRAAVDIDNFFEAYRSEWNRLSKEAAENKEGFKRYAEKLATDQGFPLTLEKRLEQLRASGFAATCAHLHLDRAVIVAKKHN
jgi:ubiquinone/menaquinone biosynthesis C-methylase UbiE